MFVTGIRKSALQAMAALAKHYPDGPFNVADISEENSFSVSYLEQLFRHLRRARLVQGVRGPGGGYILTRQPNQISLAEILEAVDPQEPVAALGKLEDEMRNVLHRYTLDRLIS